MIRHHLFTVLSSVSLLSALGVGAAEPQQQVVRNHRPAPAAVLRPVESARVGSTGEQIASSSALSPARPIERSRGSDAALRPEPAIDSPRTESRSSVLDKSPHLADRWPSARLYTVSSRSP
jgi:hypothetical protein